MDSGQDHENWEMLNGKDDKLWTTNLARMERWRDCEGTFIFIVLIKKQEDTGTKQTVNKNFMLFSGHDTVNTV